MNIINLGRGKGKTTFLVNYSAKTEKPIICCFEYQVEYIKKVAEKLNVKIPEPIIVNKNNINEVFREEKEFEPKYLIDDIEGLLNKLLGVKIDCITTSSKVMHESDLNTKTVFDGTYKYK